MNHRLEKITASAAVTIPVLVPPVVVSLPVPIIVCVTISVAVLATVSFTAFL